MSFFESSLVFFIFLSKPGLPVYCSMDIIKLILRFSASVIDMPSIVCEHAWFIQWSCLLPQFLRYLAAPLLLWSHLSLHQTAASVSRRLMPLSHCWGRHLCTQAQHLHSAQSLRLCARYHAEVSCSQLLYFTSPKLKFDESDFYFVDFISSWG